MKTMSPLRKVGAGTCSTMALRWIAAAMLEAKKGFRRLKAHKQLAALRIALKTHYEVLKQPRPCSERQGRISSLLQQPLRHFQQAAGHPRASREREMDRFGYGYSGRQIARSPIGNSPPRRPSDCGDSFTNCDAIIPGSPRRTSGASLRLPYSPMPWRLAASRSR